MIKSIITKIILLLASIALIEASHFNTGQIVSTTKITNLNSSFNDSSNSTLSQEEFLEQNLGARKHERSFIILMSTIYVLILICGLFGNISTCCVIIFNNCMHTTTNYYLFSLAVSDVLSLIIGLPVELTELTNGSYPWVFGDIFCRVRIFLFETTTIASVLTILTFTCERWLHICKAIYAKKFSSGFSRALKIILFIWTLSGLLSLPYAFTSGVFRQLDDYPESELCGSLFEHREMMGKFIISYAILFFIVPMTMISIMYVLIGIKLWKSQVKFNSEQSDSRKINKFKNFLVRKPKENTMTTNAIINNNHENDSIMQSNLNSSIETVDHNSKLKLSKHAKKQSNEINEMQAINENRTTTRDFEHISEKAKQSRRDVVKMLFVVVLGFFTCWAPFHFQRLWTSAVKNYSDSDKTVLEIIYYISGVSIYISSTINPILYNLMSKRYRTVFKSTILMFYKCQCSNKSKQVSNVYYTNKNSVHFNTLKSTTRSKIKANQ